ncbi:unnamed protein product [Eruca vesicaria subsp. sativa]|uniref:MRG domain-containing protein n=1 Tax=Eruca vesicaria subsp. sativa TaxID=29727 RepID=A0ABC8JGJ7_ERUVS|nr:unnamed protein product [Eruca vesicaria subsp. sativa]
MIILSVKSAKGKKPKTESGNEVRLKDNVSSEKLIKIQNPATLREQLTEDWENVTQKDKAKGRTSTKALPVMLLYKKERRQYQEAVVDDISPLTVYGAEHLLRLFVKFPELFFICKRGRRNMESHATNTIRLP